jgi:hypothetical protein
MAKTVKKTETKKPTVKIEVNLSIDELYKKFYSSTTIEDKLKYKKLIINLL